MIVVTNPLDFDDLSHAEGYAGFPTNRVIGQAGVLDSARMAHFIALELNSQKKTFLQWY